MATDSQAGFLPKSLYWLGWVLTLLPVPLLVMSGISKITLGPDIVKGFESMGWKSDVAMVLAVLELGSLVLYLIPQTAVLGAIFLTGYLGGAVATHVRIGDYGHCWIPAALGVVFWLGLYLRDARLRALVPLRSSNR
jgi:DoxX-like protein